MRKNQGTIFLGGPPLVKAATGETVSAEELGGAEVHTRQSGVADHYALNDDHALEIVRNIVANLNTVKKPDVVLREPRPPAYDPAELDGVVPASLMTQYDTREIIARLVDASASGRVQGQLRANAGDGLRPHRGAPRCHPGQQRHPLLGDRTQGHALHRAGLPTQDPAAVPAEHHRIHGGQGGGGRRHRQGRRQDGDGGGLRAGAEDHRHHRRLVRGRQLRHVRARLQPALPVHLAQRTRLGDGRAAGGQRPGNSAAREHRGRGQDLERRGKSAFKKPVLENFEREGHPYYATARLWDDGIIAPAETRRVVALALSAALNAPIPDMRFGVFRM